MVTGTLIPFLQASNKTLLLLSTRLWVGLLRNYPSWVQDLSNSLISNTKLLLVLNLKSNSNTWVTTVWSILAPALPMLENGKILFKSKNYLLRLPSLSKLKMKTTRKVAGKPTSTMPTNYRMEHLLSPLLTTCSNQPLKRRVSSLFPSLASNPRLSQGWISRSSSSIVKTTAWRWVPQPFTFSHGLTQLRLLNLNYLDKLSTTD